MSSVVDIARRLISEIRELRLRHSPDVQARKRMWTDSGEDEKRPLHSGVTIVPTGPKPAGGTSDRENVAYGYEIMLSMGSASSILDDDWCVSEWEEEIRRRFQFRRIGSIPSPMCELHCVVGRSKQPVDSKLAESEDVSVLSLTCFVREPRNVE